MVQGLFDPDGPDDNTDGSGWITGDADPSGTPIIPLPAAAWMGMMTLGGLMAAKKAKNRLTAS